MKKLTSLFLVLVVLLGSTALPVYAEGVQQETQGRYYAVTDLDTGLTKQVPMTYWSYMASVIHGVVDLGDGSVDAVTDVTLYKRDYKVTAKVTLQVKNSNGTWSNLKSWNGTNKSSVYVCGNYNITRSAYYRTATAFIVYDTTGKAVESDTVYSNSTYIWL